MERDLKVNCIIFACLLQIRFRFAVYLMWNLFD